MLKRTFTTIIILVLSSLSVFAVSGVDDQGNTNDPNVNDRANACYEGGSMEGKCATQAEWDAGYFLIRYEYGLLTREEVPDWVVWVLPPEVVPPEIVTSEPPTTCTITITELGQVQAPLDIINGISTGSGDSFWWSYNGLSYYSVFALWSPKSGWDATKVASTDCPTPTLPESEQI